MSKPFFITTAIDYSTGKLHVGHLYEKTIADVLARIHHLNGEKVFFSTGVDIHGEKVLEKAKEENLSPEAYTSQKIIEFKKFSENALISFDDFIHTGEERHIKSAQFFFQKMVDNGDIYSGEYEGWYYPYEETFVTDSELENDPFWKDKKSELKKVKESTYFFRWGKYQKKLEEWYGKSESNVFPSFRKKEMLEFMKKGLKDISFTRKNLSWGVPSPIDESHTIYVWGDALVNYLTVCGYPDEKYKDFWPADVHLVGLDINRFHSLLWPAMLLSAGIELPKQILVHGFVNDNNGEKMSKSKGNVVDPEEIIPKFGIEPIRYYLLRETPLGSDLSFSIKQLVARNNGELADGFGNLVNRVHSMLEKYFDSTIPDSPLDESIISESNGYSESSKQFFLSHDILNGLTQAWKIVDLANKHITDKEPWKLMKNNKKEEVSRLLVSEIELIRKIAILVSPILPLSAEKIRKQFGFPAFLFSDLNKPKSFSGKKVNKQGILFAKLE